MGQVKQVLFDVDEDLWASAKIQAIKEKIDLKDFVAQAIKNEIKRVVSLKPLGDSM